MKKTTKQAIILSAVIIPCIAIVVVGVITVYIPMLKKDPAPTYNEVSVASESKDDKDFSVPPIIPHNYNKIADTHSQNTTSVASGAEELNGADNNSESIGTESEANHTKQPTVEDTKTESATEPKDTTKDDENRTSDNPGSSGGDKDSPFYKGGDNPFSGDVSNDIKETSEITTDLSKGAGF